MRWCSAAGIILVSACTSAAPILLVLPCAMHSSDGTVHIIGAGLAGLAAAVQLAPSRRVVVHEATAVAGGRCRSYHDAATGMTIDNGSHLLLSGNRAALAYAKAIGGIEGLAGPNSADFDFFDLASRARWTVRIGDGVIPWWLLDRSRRVPGTRLSDYLPLAKVVWASGDKPLGEVIDCSGALYERLVEPLFLAALNIEPAAGSSQLAGALIRETLAAGGKACRPLIARDGVGKVFIEPALKYLAAHGAAVRFEHPLHALRCEADRATQLVFAGESTTLAADDVVILAVPAYAAAGFLPELRVPTAYRGIFNVHYRIDVPGAKPRMIGLINATSEWVFTFPGRVAVTISDGGRLFEEPRADVAARLWREVAAALDLAAEPLPPWQIVRERRATFAATPEENAKRPSARTQWGNLF